MTKEKSALIAAVSISNSFDCVAAMKYMQDHFFGLYNFMLGYYCRSTNTDTVIKVNRINEKLHPEKIIPMEEYNKIYTLTAYSEKVVVKLEGYKNVTQYYRDSSCTHRL